MRDLDQRKQGRELYLKFVDDLTHRNRFFIDETYYNYFKIFISQNEYTIDKNTSLFRGRINEKDVTTPYTQEELGMPKPDVVTSHGRVNPYGINYMYLADNPETVIAEVRPTIGELISVGRFVTTKPKRVIRINNEIGVSGSIYEDWDSLTISHFMLNLSLNFARPVDLTRRELDYLPTQFFAEYCKQQKLEGIIFQSSLMEKQFNENYNYVFFDDKDLKFQSVEVYHVNSLKYSSSKI